MKVENLHHLWGNYIPSDLRQQYEREVMEIDRRIKELEDWQYLMRALWPKFKRAWGDPTANQSSVEKFIDELTKQS